MCGWFETAISGKQFLPKMSRMSSNCWCTRACFRRFLSKRIKPLEARPGSRSGRITTIRPDQRSSSAADHFRCCCYWFGNQWHQLRSNASLQAVKARSRSIGCRAGIGSVVSVSSVQPAQAMSSTSVHGAWQLLSYDVEEQASGCLLYTSPSPRDRQKARMPSSA